MKTVLNILLFIWQLPQNLVGVLLYPCYKKLRKVNYNGKWVKICGTFPGGISLGQFILVNYNRNNPNKETERLRLQDSIKHEYGHCRQSEMLGPLYLLTVGICSGLRCMIRNRQRKNGKKLGDYYAYWTERWADKLGNVKRK